MTEEQLSAADLVMVLQVLWSAFPAATSPSLGGRRSPGGVDGRRCRGSWEGGGRG